MKDAAYWKERAEVLEEARHGEAEAYAAQLATEYDRYAAHTKAEIEKWYQRLADNNDLSLAGAHKLLKDDELVEFHWTVEEYIERGRQSAVDQRWMKQLENASAKVHISRLEAARTETQQQVEMLSAGQERGMTRLLGGVYKDAYGRTAFELQKGIGVGFGIDGIDARAVADVIRKPWTTDRRSFSDRIWTNKVELLARLQTDLTQAVMRGDNPKVLAAGIAQAFGVAKHKAERLVLTEAAYFGAQGQKDAYRELDVEAVEFVATLDGRTSDVCRSMDGQIIAMKDYEPGVTVPPLHPYCRSTTAPWFDDDFTEVEFRASRDAAGKTVYEAPADMTYPEWEEKFVDVGSKDGIKFREKGLKSVVTGKTKRDTSDKARLTKSLHEVEEAKSELDYEVGTLLSQDGMVLKVYEGSAHRIQTPDKDTPLFEDAIFTHNHPTGRGFTVQDIISFAETGLNEIRASTSQGIVYSLKVNSEEMNRAIGRVMKEEKVENYVEASTRVQKEIEEQELILSGFEYDNRVYDIIARAVDKWLMENAKEFGCVYTKEKDG